MLRGMRAFDVLLIASIASIASAALFCVACDPKKSDAPVVDAAVAAPAVRSTASSTASVEVNVPPPPVTGTAVATPPASASADAAPTTQTGAFDTSCAKDSDCVPEPGCCPVPCEQSVVNKKELPRIRERNERVCGADRRCMNAGGCRTHAYLCVRKKCGLVYSDSPDYRELTPEP
jgi:hypothetical protein